MSYYLRCKDFCVEDLVRVQLFDCGDEDWCTELNLWIRNDGGRGVTEDVKGNGVRVWLYLNDMEDIVGFASVANAKWPVRGLESPGLDVSLIYAWAIHRQFQHMPKDHHDLRYSKQIFEDILSKCKNINCSSPENLVGLYVHPMNPAIRFYLKYGFEISIFEKEFNPRYNIHYLGMLLDLNRYVNHSDSSSPGMLA